jgi:hypothetical protein
MIRKILHRALILLGCVALVGGAVAWYVWVNGDAYARDELQRRLSELAPSCDLAIGMVRFDWNQSLTVRDFAMGSKRKGVPPTLTVPEGVIEIDRGRFVNERIVEVTTIRLIRPQLDLVRRVDGAWAIRDLMPFHLNDIPLPEWKIEDGTLRFILEQPSADPVVLVLRDANLRLVPADGKRLLVKGLGDVSDAGQMEITGEIDLEQGSWSLSGSVKGLSTAGDIAGFAMRSSAGLREKVASLGEKLRETEDQLISGDEAPAVVPNSVPVRTVSRVSDSAPSGGVVLSGTIANGAMPISSVAREPARDLAGLGIEAIVDVSFTVARSQPDQPIRFVVGLDCKDGQVQNAILPFPLGHLRGRIDWNNEQLKLSSLQADSGKALVKIDGEFALARETPTGWFSINVSDLVLSDKHDGKLPPGIVHFLDIVRPSGPIDMVGTFERDLNGEWTAREFLLTAKGASALPQPFPYPIRDIVGTLRQTQPGRLVAKMTGTAGTRPVQLEAYVTDPGPFAEVDVRISTDQVPLDDMLLNACQPHVRETLETIGLQGVSESLNVVITRKAGPDQKYNWRFQTNVIDGVIEYEHFPYRLTKATGNVAYDSEQKSLTLRNIVATHNAAVLKGEGTFREPPDLRSDGTSPIGGPTPGLDLTVNASRVGIDTDLRSALPLVLQKTWDELRPEGVADADAKVVWIPGHEPDIELTKLTLSGGRLYAKRFPYVLEHVEAKARYVPPRVLFQNGRPSVTPAKVDVTDFVGWHAGGVRVESPQTTFRLFTDGTWNFRLPQLKVEDLQFGSEFRRAMPERLSQTLESLNPRGRFQVEGQLDLQGSTMPGAPTNAGWDLTATTHSAAITAAVELQNLSGSVRVKGTQSGEQVELNGGVNFATADLLGQRLQRVRGPFNYKNGRVEIGSANVVAAADESVVPPENQLVADYLGGLLTFDAELLLDRGPSYAARATLSGGSLQRYAENQPGRNLRNLAGVMNGFVNLRGQGTSPAGITGNGSLDISPAALYELPVIMQILTLLSSPDNTAFRKATSDFTIHDSAFHFRQSEGGAIVLAGDALWLVGQGRVTFDRKLELELYNVPPKTAVSRVPVLGPVVGGILNVATSGWMNFVVRGTADDPVVRMRALPNLDDGLRRMFEAFGPPPPSKTAARPGALR